MNKSPHFLSVIKNDEVSKHCRDVLATHNATCDNIKKFDDLNKLPSHTRFNGIMLDLHSLFKLSTLDRAFFKLHVRNFPTLKFVWNPRNGSIMVTQTSLDDVNVKDINEFVKHCKRITPCGVRRERRYSTVLNATLNDHLVNIDNISKHGCFVLTTIESFQIGEEVSITIKEFCDQAPISCIIHRRVDWGEKDNAAGIGVEFLSMTETQRNELGELLSTCEEKMEKELQFMNDYCRGI
jgi:Tfp pilus assembly protein PilZ